RPVHFDALDASGFVESDVSEIRLAPEAGARVHEVPPDYRLPGIIDRSHGDPGANAVVVGAVSSQAKLDPGVALHAAVVHEELIHPLVAGPAAAEHRIDVLIAVPVEIEEDDAVSLLDVAESLEHGDVLAHARAGVAVALAGVYQIGHEVPGLRIARA